MQNGLSSFIYMYIYIYIVWKKDILFEIHLTCIRSWWAVYLYKLGSMAMYHSDVCHGFGINLCDVPVHIPVPGVSALAPGLNCGRLAQWAQLAGRRPALAPKEPHYSFGSPSHTCWHTWISCSKLWLCADQFWSISYTNVSVTYSCCIAADSQPAADQLTDNCIN